LLKLAQESQRFADHARPAPASFTGGLGLAPSMSQQQQLQLARKVDLLLLAGDAQGIGQRLSEAPLAQWADHDSCLPGGYGLWSHICEIG
jgi:hypothetical protein